LEQLAAIILSTDHQQLCNNLRYNCHPRYQVRSINWGIYYIAHINCLYLIIHECFQQAPHLDPECALCGDGRGSWVAAAALQETSCAY